MPRRIASTFYPAMAIACFSYALFVLLLLHVLRRDYVPRSHMISDYGVGPYGWVMSTCFIAMAAGVAMTLLGLWRSGPRCTAARVGTALLGIAAIGLVVSAMFPTDLPGALSTRTGQLHTISFLANLGSIISGTALVSLGCGRDHRWRSYRSIALILVAMIVIAFVLQFLTLHKGMPYGYTNRLLVMTLCAWFFATAIRLRNVALNSPNGGVAPERPKRG